MTGDTAKPNLAKADSANETNPEQTLRLLGLEASVRVETDFGPVPVMLLRPRDRLRTVGGGFVRLASVKKTAFDTDLLKAHPAATAVRIEEGVFGSGLPRQTVCVAPHQTIAGDPLRKGNETVVAEDCVGHPGVTRATVEETVYHVLTCESSAQILAEGLAIRV
ncbi:MAG: Hint domain-containing protein [Pseudomonadota bacterium]